MEFLKALGIYALFGLFLIGGFVVITLILRSRSDRQRGTGTDDQNSDIENGIGKCSESLQQAEDILSGAIKRSETKTGSPMGSDGN